MKFPKKIFISIENEGEENEYLNPQRTIKEFDSKWPNGGKVGVYELKEVQEVTWEYTTKSVR